MTAVSGVRAACLTPIRHAECCGGEAAGTVGEDVVAEGLLAVYGDRGAGVVAVVAEGVAGITVLGGDEAERGEEDEEVQGTMHD